MSRWVVWIRCWMPVLFVVGGSTGVAVAQQQSVQLPPPVVSPERALANQYCLACHNPTAKTAGLDLDTISSQGVSRQPEVWEKVIRKLRARHMPPVGMPRPEESTYNAVVSSLEASLDSAAAARPRPGRTDTFRRLNRTEYRNAIRDLLALDVDVTSLLPSDDSSHGFDNVTVGDLSPTLLDRYVSAAEKISRLALGRPSRSPGEDAGTEPEVLEAVLVALELGADINAIDVNGETAMHGAAYKNLPKVVELLAEKGARIEIWNRKNKQGWTPLTIAEGHRFGNFKPSPVTVAAFHRVMSAAGVSTAGESHPVPSAGRKSY